MSQLINSRQQIVVNNLMGHPVSLFHLPKEVDTRELATVLAFVAELEPGKARPLSFETVNRIRTPHREGA